MSGKRMSQAKKQHADRRRFQCGLAYVSWSYERAHQQRPQSADCRSDSVGGARLRQRD